MRRRGLEQGNEEREREIPMERDDDGKRSIVERVSADFAKVIRTNDFSKVYEEKV